MFVILFMLIKRLRYIVRNVGDLSESDYFKFVYRHCSIDGPVLAFHTLDSSSKLTSVDSESLREAIVLDCAKVFSDLLMCLNGLKGSLSIPILPSNANDSSVMGDIDSSSGKSF